MLSKIIIKIFRYYSVAVKNRFGLFSMNVINIQDSGNYQKYVNSAVSDLLNGSVIALPTDTIYGIAGLLQNEKAIEEIYKIKRRKNDKPLAICVSDIDEISIWGKVTVPDELLKSLLPGPVTIILERTEALSPFLNPGNRLVGIRIPDCNFIRDVVSKCGSPIALTSANISTEKSPLSIDEFQELWAKLHKVYDGGVLRGTRQSRKGSTIVDLSSTGFYKVVRKGSAFSNTTKVLQKFGLKRLSV